VFIPATHAPFHDSLMTSPHTPPISPPPLFLE
jgi:hypothetical protein